MRNRFGHRWLGFSETLIAQWFSETGIIINEKSQYEGRDGLKINLFVGIKV